MTSSSSVLRSLFSGILSAGALACSDPSSSPAGPTSAPNMIILTPWQLVVEVGRSVSVAAQMSEQSFGFGPNTYFSLDSAQWSTANPSIASIVSPTQGPYNEAVVRGNEPGTTNLDVTDTHWHLSSSATVHVMPAVRKFELRTDRDTIYGGESATVSPYVEFFDGTDPHAYLSEPYLIFAAEPCRIGCATTTSGSGFGGRITITANGIFGGIVTFHGRFGQGPFIDKYVVAMLGRRP